MSRHRCYRQAFSAYGFKLLSPPVTVWEQLPPPVTSVIVETEQIERKMSTGGPRETVSHANSALIRRQILQATDTKPIASAAESGGSVQPILSVRHPQHRADDKLFSCVPYG